MSTENLDRLLSAAKEFDGSDLHLVTGVPPAFRVNGEIIIADEDALTEEEITRIAYSLLNEQQKKKFEQEWELCISLLHKSAGGGVALGITDEPELRARSRAMREHFGDDLLGYLVQPMATPGRELLVGVVGDASFGPLVVFGLGGTDTDVVDKRVSCLVPVTDVDSHELLRSLPAPKALADVDVDAVAATVMRVGRLAELLPEVAEMDLNPLIAYETGCVVADARILLRPVEPADMTLRTLRV